MAKILRQSCRQEKVGPARMSSLVMSRPVWIDNAHRLELRRRAMPATRVELLQAMPIFGGIRDDTLQFLLAQSASVSVSAGDFFFREGDAASGMFVLERGRVAISKRWKDRDFILRDLSRGDCFGEMALMDLQPRSASVKAIEDCSAIRLAGDGLYQLFGRDVEQFALIQMNMGREVSRRLRATDELLFHAEMGAGASTSDRLLRST